MAAPSSQGEAQKLRFGPWLLAAVESGKYPGLCWTDRSRRCFRVPWKHNARRDVTSSDVEVFKAWAVVSGHYEGCPEDPAKWKTNFRCALRSTRMFLLLEDHSKCGDDPHKVFIVSSAAPGHSQEGASTSPAPVLDQQTELECNQQDVTPEIAPPGSTDPAQSRMQEKLETLQWVLQHCAISPPDSGSLEPSWAGDIPPQDILLQPHPDPSQNSHLPQWVPVLEQPLLDTCPPLDPLLLQEDEGTVPLLCHPPDVMGPVAHPEAPILLVPSADPVPPPVLEEEPGPLLILDITILYRGRQVLREEVRGSQCLLASQLLDPELALLPGQKVMFPSAAELPDRKQRRYTERLLLDAGLRLEQRAQRIVATRLKRCQVFWALGRQLEGPQDPPCNLLQRNQETPIFDFSCFCTELSAFRSSQRKQSPDFIIYFCFGQCFSKARGKESRLILVKLVPRLCQYLCEKVQQEGASSLDSDTISLKLSDSFSLYELIEHWPMQVD
ncbi:interferon regulatory factor 7 [Indicator indicator]|uniref:interferon regulatory factor 7 n=1 Tax=Indicator indicator TaxID=1002788 RepID=UPI0023DEB98B|nr:interferon regulatory factor 7 [Indicator indicator]